MPGPAPDRWVAAQKQGRAKRGGRSGPGGSVVAHSVPGARTITLVSAKGALAMAKLPIGTMNADFLTTSSPVKGHLPSKVTALRRRRI